MNSIRRSRYRFISTRRRASSRPEPRSPLAITSRAWKQSAGVQHWLQTIDDPWLHVRSEAVHGEFARIKHPLRWCHPPPKARRRDVSPSGIPANRGVPALQSLGRAQCQAGDYDGGSLTLELTIVKAEATGDVRLAPIARFHLGRVLRALGQDSQAHAALEAATMWHRAGSGGEQAALGECLLAALEH